MKKILAFLLAATMLSAMFVLPSAAADNVNYEVDFKYVEKAPVQDGVVNSKEYGDVLPTNTFSKSRSQFVYNKGHTKYTKWDFDFYSAWDKDNLYLAWVVRSDIHGAVPKAQLGDLGEVVGTDYATNETDTLQKMWMYSCVQLVLTPGNPTAEDYAGNNNWLEVGFCEMEDHTTGRAVWGVPQGVAIEDISLDSWTAVAKRDDVAETTTYEIAIPWSMTGIYQAGTDKQFGLAYAVATQEQYYSKTPAMIEWQDVILTGSSSKKANNAAIVTMKGGNVDINTGRKAPGSIPAELKDKTHLIIDGFNKRIVGNDSVIITKPKTALDSGILGVDEGDYNLVWTYNLLLKPTGNANEYEVVTAEQGLGSDPSFAGVEVTDDMLLVAFHSDGTAGTDHYTRREAAMALGAGTILKSWEIDFSKPDTNYKNSSFYVEKSVVAYDPTADVFGAATIDGKVEKDGDVAVYEAGEEDRVITVAEANLNNAYILIFDNNEEAPKLVQLGEKIATDITLPAGYKAMTFFYDDENQTNIALKGLYDGAMENFVSEEIADNGLRSIDPELGCPYALYYDVVDGVADFWIPKTEQAPVEPTPSTPVESTPATSSDAASSEASDASDAGEDEGGSNLGLIIGIIVGVLVLAGAGVAVFFVLKKKKAA